MSLRLRHPSPCYIILIRCRREGATRRRSDQHRHKATPEGFAYQLSCSPCCILYSLLYILILW